MSGRRSHVRFIVNPPSHGVVRVLSDAEIQSAGHEEVLLVSREAAAVGEQMILEVSGDTADLSVLAQVTEGRPVIVGNTVRHLLRLRALGRSADRAGFGPLAQMDWQAADARLVVVVREFPVRLVNCSPSGCLFEADKPLEVGTVGTLSLVMEGHELADHVLVMRCQGIAGAGPLHHIGARLLWVEAPSAHTLRRGLIAAGHPA
ncbi:MAG: hypothetical protein ACRD3C_23225 [Vicinamibacterales bacterium]